MGTRESTRIYRRRSFTYIMTAYILEVLDSLSMSLDEQINPQMRDKEKRILRKDKFLISTRTTTNEIIKVAIASLFLYTHTMNIQYLTKTKKNISHQKRESV